MSTPLRSLLLAALAVGLALPAAAQVQLQVIHNAADPAAAEVDVYVNGALTLDDFAFRTATAFLDLPANTDLAVAIAPGTSTSADDAVFSQTYNLPDGAYQLVANGVLAPDAFAPNPDGRDIGFQLIAGLDAQDEAGEDNKAELRVVHGATDAPTVDVRTAGAILVDDAAYSDVTGYLEVDPQAYTLDITTANGEIVASFLADLSGAAGAALTVLASGFLDPAANQNGEAFGLLAVFPSGDTVLLPSVVVDAEDAPGAETLALGVPAPNPLRDRGTVAFSLDAPGPARLALYDALGREVAVLADASFSADRHEARLDTRALASGVYVLRLQAASGVRAQTLTVVR